MTACVRKKGKVYRVVECGSAKLVKARDKGKATDGGGHRSKAKALRQAAAINSNK